MNVPFMNTVSGLSYKIPYDFLKFNFSDISLPRLGYISFKK